MKPSRSPAARGRFSRVLTIAAALSLAHGAALAADLDGRTLGLAWALPFVGILLSIALLPLFASHFWEHHLGKIAAFWAALTVLPGRATLQEGGIHLVVFAAFVVFAVNP